ncbi:hypothetical protein HII31_06244 [Pseudocercospora fuligena]|uniref:Uncharacterized protein n=1 Tax=Pseudocercospora fuligena TaxID=685502 RepID=A0A8H6RJV9_9PEZI|nr:hypothetical protein HII31_06244 [Pseudocercospora fuligena]
MKTISTFTLALATVAPLASAGWIYPTNIWKPISFTLPGSTFRRRDLSNVAESTAELEKRASSVDLYAACSKLNMASKYKNFPINGYLYSGGAVGSGSASASVGGSGSAASACASDGTGDMNCGSNGAIFTEQGSDASSAYDCCVQAQKLQDSAFFFYTSNPSQFSQKCTVVRTNYCSYSKYSTIISAAAFNGSAPRGTSYYNYIGNGRCGPGVTAAINFPSGGLCAASGSAANGLSAGSAAAASAACGYSPPNIQDLGGATPAG